MQQRFHFLLEHSLSVAQGPLSELTPRTQLLLSASFEHENRGRELNQGPGAQTIRSIRVFETVGIGSYFPIYPTFWWK